MLKTLKHPRCHSDDKSIDDNEEDGKSIDDNDDDKDDDGVDENSLMDMEARGATGKKMEYRQKWTR